MKIAIAGYGIEGKASYEYWSRDPANELVIVDALITDRTILPAGVACILGPDAFADLNGFDMVIRTPGLSPYSITTDGKVWSATNEFFDRCPAPIIGVTGSKGKGTTASFIAAILEAAGRNVWLVGNIGLPGLAVIDQIIPEDIVVYELSSFQLWDCQFSPHTAVMLFMEREHLDVHPSMEDYVAAKAHIAAKQSATDVMVYAAHNKYSLGIGESSAAVKIGFPSNATAHIKDGFFWNGEQKLCSIDVVRLKGEHNLMNAVAAINAVWEYTQSAEAISKGLAEFTGLPHRLAFVSTVSGISYYDDSIATTPAAALAAVAAFPGQHKVLILGGSSKGSDFAELARQLKDDDVDVLLIGKEGARIKGSLDSTGMSRYQSSDAATMTEIVTAATALARPGSVVLLSPAAASFDLFKNYTDRGDQFIAAVNNLGEANT